jgi:hypothetical protein
LDSHNHDQSNDDLVEQGQQLYEQKLKSILEPEHNGRFVAIDPSTGTYFLADTGTDALLSAHQQLPDTLFYLMRVGFKAADTIAGYGHRNR